jgi:hypothetical protein
VDLTLHLVKRFVKKKHDTDYTDKICENPCHPCQKFLVPAVQFSGLDFLSVMRERMAFWTKQSSGRGWNWNCSCAKRVLNRWNFAETNPARCAIQLLDSVDDFNRTGSFSVRSNVNGNLQPASWRRNSKRFHAWLHQIKRHLRQGLAVGDRSLSACFLSQFQRIYFSSHDVCCRNSCARKKRFAPCFY